MARGKYKILIVDDHPIFCLGMGELINKEPDMAVCGNADSAKAAHKAILDHLPDLVIVDISLKDSNGLDLVKEIDTRFRGIPVLVLSMYDESLYAERALLSGARGYIMKQGAIGSVVQAIRLVMEGKIYASDAVKEKVFERLVSHRRDDEISPLDTLTDRELEVFRLIGEGLSTKEIAARMSLSIKTIGTYREKLKEKLNLKHYTQLVQFAVHWSNHNRK